MFRGFDRASPLAIWSIMKIQERLMPLIFHWFKERAILCLDFTPQNVIAYPSFVDIDNDGDMDVFGGNYVFNTPILKYYENTGTTTAPSFVDVSGAANPLDTIVSAIQVNGVNNNYQPFLQI